MRKIVCIAITLTGLSATAFPADRHMAFERNNAVYVANLDGTNEKKIADGIFSAISPDGARVAFNTVEKRAVRLTCGTWRWQTSRQVWRMSLRTLSNDEFFCILQKENENEPSIYRMSLNGKNARLLVKHARTPSASAP